MGPTTLVYFAKSRVVYLAIGYVKYSMRFNRYYELHCNLH